jgi:hypothetical protein
MFFMRVMSKLAGATVKCNARQKAAAPNGLECRESQLAIEDDISISGKSPEYSSLHTFITTLFHFRHALTYIRVMVTLPTLC